MDSGITYLHPEEKSSWLWLDFEEVDTVFCLFDFLKLCNVWEKNEGLLDIFLLIEVFKVNHTGLHWVSLDSDEATASVRGHHTSIVVHPACLELAERRRTAHGLCASRSHLSQKCLKLSLIHFDYVLSLLTKFLIIATK